MSEDEEYEEKEILVHVDFNTRIEDEILDNLEIFKLIGLDTEAPVLQIGHQIFRGEWRDTIGTHVFLEEDSSATPGDVFERVTFPMYKYACKSSKLLQMQRVFVREKSEKEFEEPVPVKMELDD